MTEKNNNFLQVLIDLIPEEKVLQLLKDRGIGPAKPIKENSNEIWFRTVCHGGDSSKLCYFRDSKSFYCYTNCGFMSLYNFLMEIDNINFTEAVVLVRQMAGISSRKGFQVNSDNNKDVLELERKLLLKNKHKKQKPKVNKLPAIKSDILNYFEDVYFEGWIREGITIDTMEEFNIKWYELEKHIIIPHYNVDDELVGIRRRSLQLKDANNKYMPEIIEGVTYAHALNLNFYGLNKVKDNIKKFKKVIITEAEKSVLQSYSFYGEQSYTIATCGFNISNWHRDMILSMGVEEVILAFDKDFDPVLYDVDNPEKVENYADYERYYNRIVSFVNLFSPYCKVSVIWDSFGLLDIKDSPFDKGKEVFEKLMQKRTIIMD
jgi:hypothetical protein